MKHFYEVTWYDVWEDPTGLTRSTDLRVKENVIAEDELDACCKVADRHPHGYGFEAVKTGR